MTDPTPSEKYRNPDPRCGYPWADDFSEYCLSYACHIGGEERYRDMEGICPGCKYFTPAKPPTEET